MKAKQKAIIFSITTLLDIILISLIAVQVNKSNSIEQKYLVKANEQVVAQANEIDSKEKDIQNDIIEEKVDTAIVSAEKEIIREEVFEGMTIEELSAKLDRSLNSTISGKGNLIATRSIEHGMDPYLVTGIMLLETGCKWECSYLVKQCNNVGGQKGSGCGSYTAYPTLDEGIIGYIDNLYYNYYSKGLTTPELMNSKYAESNTWAIKVNNYIEQIKAQ